MDGRDAHVSDGNEQIEQATLCAATGRRDTCLSLLFSVCLLCSRAGVGVGGGGGGGGGVYSKEEEGKGGRWQVEEGAGRQEEEEEEEEVYSGANTVNEEDPERDRATQV